jgi:putative transposase
VRYLEMTYQISERRGCRVLRANRSGHRYRTIRHDQAVLRRRIREIAAARVRYGYFRIYIVLRREGLKINHKRVYRLYREEGLSMRMRGPRRHISAARRMERPQTNAANQCWSMDFVSDALFDGRRIRALTVIDNHTRESLAIEVGHGISGEQVASVMNRIIAVRGAPLTIRVDNELSKKAMAREEYTSAMARRASNFGYDSAKPEGTVRQRGSLRAGAPSRIRSRSSPADAALDRRRRCG